MAILVSHNYKVIDSYLWPNDNEVVSEIVSEFTIDIDDISLEDGITGTSQARASITIDNIVYSKKIDGITNLKELLAENFRAKDQREFDV